MKYKNSGLCRGLSLGITAIAMLAVVLPAAHADVVSGNSKGYGIDVALTVLNIPLLTISELPMSSGSAPGPYNDSDQILSISESVPLIVSLGTGVLDTTASSDIDGGSGVRMADASALVNDLVLTLVPGVGVPALLNLTADTIGSDSTVSGDFGAHSAVGNMVLENLLVSVSGTALSVPLNPAPNTVLWDAAGLRIVLNEQTSFTGGFGASMDTNAIHISLVDIATVGGLVNGDIIISHSDAAMVSAVPEPATFVALGSLSLLALLRRRR